MVSVTLTISEKYFYLLNKTLHSWFFNILVEKSVFKVDKSKKSKHNEMFQMVSVAVPMKNAFNRDVQSPTPDASGWYLVFHSSFELSVLKVHNS